MRLNGTWNLEVSTPFGKHPATLVIESAPGGNFTGRLDSRLGKSPLDDINQTPDGFDATVSVELQGRSYGAQVSASVEDDKMEGQIRVRLPMAPPARFTGTRSKQDG